MDYQIMPNSADESAQRVRRRFLVIYGLATVLGITMSILLAVWLTNFGNGGFGWDSSHIFNYHPLFMTVGLVLLFAKGSLMYRLLPQVAKQKVKIAHMVMNLLSLIMSVAGLTVIIIFKNENGYKHFYSIHAWLGICAIVLFATQWVCGLLIFLYPGASQPIRAAYLNVHSFLGAAIFGLACAAAVTGLAKKAEGVAGYHDLSSSGLTINFTAVTLILFCICVLYLLSDRNYRRQN